MIFKRLVILFILIIAISSQAEFSADDIIVNSGDAIRVLVYDGAVVPAGSRFISQFHNQEFVIDGNGEIRLYSLGTIKVAELTVEEIQTNLVEKFKPYAKNPNVVVIPLVRLVFRGEFGSAGMYRFSVNTSFWDVISEVGGVHNSFSLTNMYIVRDGGILFENFEEYFYKAKSIAEMGLQSGDEIIAPRQNRISFGTIMRYFQFASSVIVLYVALTNDNGLN